MKQQTMKLKFVMLVIVLFSAMTGCEEATQDPPNDLIVQEYSNPNPPNANELISQQMLIGDADQQSSIWEIIDSGDGGFYFRGYFHDRYALGKLDQTGNEVWTFRSRYSVRDCIRISELSGDLNNCLLTAGSFDSNFDGDLDIGYVSLFNSTGSLIDELSFSHDTTKYWLSALAVSEASDNLCHLLAVGTAEVASIYYPYIARFTVAGDSTMQKIDEKIFMDRPMKNFRNIQFDAAQSPSICYLQGDEYSHDIGYGDQAVYRLSDELDILWSVDIVPQAGFQSWTLNGRGFLCSGNKLYLACTTEIDKEEDPTSGGYWDAGGIACLSTDGSEDWGKKIILSQYSERLRSCFLNDGILYVTGTHSSFFREEKKNLFGNALLLKVNPESGEIVSDLSFGNKYYRSDFNDVIVRGTTAFAVGYTNYEVENGPYQGWFVVIDVSGSSILSEPSIPVLGPSWDRNSRKNLENLEGP